MTLPRRNRRAGANQPLLPLWIPADHPLHLNQAARQRIRRNFDRRAIFLNIPYSERYSKLEVAILSTVTAYGLRPWLTRQRMRFEPRLLRIAEMILTCRYGLTDLTYVKRMNMPLELGLLLAFGKDTFVMSRRHYSALRTISDLNFSDVHYHEGSVTRLIDGLSRWIEQACSSKRLSMATLIQRYRRVRKIRNKLGTDFDRRTPQEIVKLLGVARKQFRMELLPT